MNNDDSDFRIGDLVEILSGFHKGRLAYVLQTKGASGLESSYISLSLKEMDKPYGLCVVSRSNLKLVERTEVKVYRRKISHSK